MFCDVIIELDYFLLMRIFLPEEKRIGNILEIDSSKKDRLFVLLKHGTFYNSSVFLKLYCSASNFNEHYQESFFLSSHTMLQRMSKS